MHQRRHRGQRHGVHMQALGDIDPDVAQQVAHFLADKAASALPGPLAAALSTLGGDVADALTLRPSPAGLARLTGLWYLLWTRPSPLVGVLDFYVFNPVAALLSPSFNESSFTLRDRLGGGNYGQGALGGGGRG